MREELFDSILSQVRKNAEVWKLKENLLCFFFAQPYHYDFYCSYIVLGYFLF